MNLNTSVMRLAAACAALCLLISGGTALADAKKTTSGWTFQVSPYLWMSGIKGNVGAIQGVPPASIDVDFSDIFNHIDWPAAVFLSGEARNGAWGILGDVEYVKLEVTGSTPGTLFSSASLTQWNFNSTIEGEYRFLDMPQITMDALLGVRIFYVDNELTLAPGDLPGRSGSSGDVWADPVLGVRGNVPLGKSGFFLNGYGDVGGFGIDGGDLTWELYGGLGYNFNSWFSAYAGYRYLNVQHSDGGFVYDIHQDGPLIGAGFRF